MCQETRTNWGRRDADSWDFPAVWGSPAEAAGISPLRCQLTAIPVDCISYKEGIGSLLALAMSVPFSLSDLGLQSLMGAPIYIFISEVSSSGKFLPSLTSLRSRNFSDGGEGGSVRATGDESHAPGLEGIFHSWVKGAVLQATL